MLFGLEVSIELYWLSRSMILLYGFFDFSRDNVSVPLGGGQVLVTKCFLDFADISPVSEQISGKTVP